MGVRRVQWSELTEVEQRELTETLTTDRFVSNEGDAMALWLPLFLLGLGGVVFGLVNPPGWTFSEMRELVAADPSLFLRLLVDPFVMAPIVGALTSLCVARYFLRVHKRHGDAVTSFAVLSLRGSRLRMLRFIEARSVESHRVRARRSFTVTTVTADDGSTFVTYATRLSELIRQRVEAAQQRPG